MIINPYLNRVAIRDPKHFVGRRREIGKIFSRIGASRPQSIAVVGDRRIGKSSLLNQIFNSDVRASHLERPDDYVFLFIDLQQRKHIAPVDLFQDIFGQLAEALGEEFPAGIVADFDGMRKVLGKFRQIGRKLIILFDEFDAVTTNSRFDLDFYSFLRAAANNYDVAYVTSSARDLQDLCHTAQIADSPFFNIFTNVYLRTLAPPEVRQLVIDNSAAVDVPLEPYFDRIVEIAGAFPFFLQIACSSWFEALTEETPADRVDAVARELFLDEARGHFRFIWEHFEADHRDVIRTLLTGGQVDAQKNHVLDDLRRNGYVTDGPDGPRTFSSAFVDAISRALPAIAGDAVIPPTEKFSPSDPRELVAPGGDIAQLLADRGRIGRFVIRERLGGGGMGDVYSAVDSELTRTVAVKVLGMRYAADPTSKRRFLREAQMASILNHPNIATIYEIGELSGIPYIVMEYVEGRTLTDLLSADGRQPIATVIEVGRQMASALEEAHEKGVVHRDIKSSNIILTSKGLVKILDFGLAKPLPLAEKMREEVSDITEPGVLIGTITYMSPEQASGKGEVTHLSDIFSLGVVLYEMTTGELPFDAETYFQIISKITGTQARPITELRPDAPRPLTAVIDRMMAKDPGKRFASARALERELKLLALVQSSAGDER